jgi:hypothetical protein
MMAGASLRPRHARPQNKSPTRAHWGFAIGTPQWARVGLRQGRVYAGAQESARGCEIGAPQRQIVGYTDGGPLLRLSCNE